MLQSDNHTAPLNLLVTLDENYIPYLNVMLYSLLQRNPQERFRVYLLHTNIPETALTRTRQLLGEQNPLIPVRAEGIGLDGAPTTPRYPKEIYYRIFAARYLPEDLDRILYLDPDLIVNGSLRKLYETPMEDYFFAAASHIGFILHRFHELRLDIEKESPYVNSGVMLMNLEKLRKEQRPQDVFDFIEEKKDMLVLPDQDIINCLYGTKIYALDTFRYNMTEPLFMHHSLLERDLDLDWVRKNSVIIHYCGRNKPWKSTYVGPLGCFYQEAAAGLAKAFPAAEGDTP